ncbi:hypothetical protein ATCV1_z577L [Acanthocystis turfacea chlorella virus 1]|uniref:Uncharacterized protein z577L n=1 Tax=Chlorovirus heliozoae TaxID=322019 RepID=A7K9I7_9PHYC|nr:hypothetical protein ATCV1_z577L [Acanthocystis turfacea chlorella virus 1]ABT16711.1 hypothetical protein ATCV1_z577L [Acanthocystis turfacea chlorella virus 1]
MRSYHKIFHFFCNLGKLYRNGNRIFVFCLFRTFFVSLFQPFCKLPDGFLPVIGHLHCKCIVPILNTENVRVFSASNSC